MEIKPNQIALSFAEARWAEEESAFLPPDLRRKIEQARRSVLAPYLGANLIDGVPLLADDLPEYGTERFKTMDKLSELRAKMREVESDYAALPDAASCPVELDASRAELESLYKIAVLRYEDAGIVATDPDPVAKLNANLEAELGEVPPEALYNADNLNSVAGSLEEMAVTGGVIQAISHYRQQLA